MVLLTVTVHTSALELAFKPHPIEASEDADALKLALDEFTLVPETDMDTVKHGGRPEGTGNGKQVMSRRREPQTWNRRRTPARHSR